MTRVLIADDEPKIRKALRTMFTSLDQDIEIVGEAENGADVFSQVENLNPDILFLDIVMPKADGLTILEWLHEKQYNTKTIIISGYNDFAYAKKAISFDAVEYILKPFDTNDVRSALHKAMCKIGTEKTYKATQMRLQKISKEDDYRKSKELMRKIYYGHKLNEEETNSISPVDGWKVLLLVVKNYKTILEDQYEKDSEILSFSISRFSEEVLAMNSQHFLTSISPHNAQMCWIAIPDTHPYAKDQKCIRQLFVDYLKVDCFICYSDRFCRAEELSQRIQRLEEIVFLINLPDLQEKSGIFCVDDMTIMPNNDKLLEQINKTVREVNYIVRHSLYFDVKPFIDGIFKFALEQNRLSVQYLFTVYTSFKSELEQLMPDSDNIEAEIVERNGFGLHIQFDGQKADKLLTDMITNGIIGYKAYKQGNVAGGRIEMIKEYIDISFTEDLSLESLAIQFFISKQYLANRFKSLTDATVLDYIHNKRLMKAKEMLADSSSQVSDIAALVGYDSVSYFNKLFRRRFGITPTEYRKQNKIKS